ncbi:unnamed protein product [Blepharisma stoltei]|uniref:Uncharacterized protein n=1 Tax=Blepharisma stoltei TaxID=1481888 RepID=A0AAU9K840_9CILI|nr:unnamed protein product [Blepharisma stoltei]
MLNFPVYGTLNGDRKTIIRHPTKLSQTAISKPKCEAPYADASFELLQKTLKEINEVNEKLKEFRKDGLKQTKLRKSMESLPSKMPQKRKSEIPNKPTKKPKLDQSSLNGFCRAWWIR